MSNMTTQHTPVKPRTWGIPVDATPEDTVTVWVNGIDTTVPVGLIAAAPEMLEALQSYLKDAPYAGWDEVGFIKAVKSVVRKATEE